MHLCLTGTMRTAAARAILTGQHILTFDFVTCVCVTVKSEPDTCRIKRILLAPVGRVLHPLHEYGASAWKSNGGRTLMTPEYSTIYRASLSSLHLYFYSFLRR